MTTLFQLFLNPPVHAVQQAPVIFLSNVRYLPFGKALNVGVDFVFMKQLAHQLALYI